MPVSVPVPLLWTGGWGLDTSTTVPLIIKKQPVEPHNIVTVDRPSIGAELRTMARLEEELFRDFPGCRALLRPSHLFDVTDLTPNETTAAQIRGLKAVDYIGRPGSAWGASVGARGPVAQTRLSAAFLFLREDVRRIESRGGCGRSADAPANPNLLLFRGPFRFPLFELTKLDMEKRPPNTGLPRSWSSAWFCHKPLPSNVRAGGAALWVCHDRGHEQAAAMDQPPSILRPDARAND